MLLQAIFSYLSFLFCCFVFIQYFFMKKLLLCLSLLFSAQFVFAAFPKLVVDSMQTSSTDQQRFFLKQLGSMTMKEFGQRTGRKLSFRERLVFKLMQHRFKNEPKEKHKSNVFSTLGGFLLGFYLLFIGVGIAYLLPKNKTLRKSAWIGFGVVAAISLFVLLLIFTGAIPLFS